MALNRKHVVALVRKEIQQIRADRSVLIIAFVLPILLVLLYGSALRMDVKPVNVALVSSQVENGISKEVAFALAGSEYFNFTQVSNTLDAQELLKTHAIDGYVVIPSNFDQYMYHHDIQIMIMLNGSNAALANLARGYIENVLLNAVNLKGLTRQVSYITQGPQMRLAQGLSNTYQSPLSTSVGRGQEQAGAHSSVSAAASASTVASVATTSASSSSSSSSTTVAAPTNATASEHYKPVQMEMRNWFNESNDSTWYMMAGQLIGTITMMAAFMSSIVIAREFERGTLLGLKATHVTAGEVLWSKFIVYYAISCIGACLAIFFALSFYDLPFRGSVPLLILSDMVYLFVIVMMAFVISTATQNQFLASQYATILSFLPSILLSGAVFDLRAISPVISFIAHLLPPTYAVSSSKICILSGGSEEILLRNTAILFVFGLFFTGLAYKLLSRQFKRYEPLNAASVSLMQECSQERLQEQEKEQAHGAEGAESVSEQAQDQAQVQPLSSSQSPLQSPSQAQSYKPHVAAKPEE